MSSSVSDCKSQCLAGLWLNIPDYDAPTQMVKPKERNERYVDAVLTIPKVLVHHICGYLGMPDHLAFDHNLLAKSPCLR